MAGLKKQAKCHPEKQHQAKGLCRDCYNSQYASLERNKATRRISRKVHREANLAIYRERDKLYYESNKDLCKVQHAKYSKSLKGRAKANALHAFKYANDIHYKLSCTLRRRLKTALRGNYKTGSAINALGCSIDSFKAYLESLWRPGMSWNNHSNNGWHIDHIIPLSSATTSEELLKLCHYTNLQPLWALDNRKKSDKYGEGLNGDKK